MLFDLIQTLLVAAALAYLGLVLLAWRKAPGMIFPQPPAGYADGPDILKLPLPDGSRCSARHRPHAQARGLLLFHHGNGEDIGSVQDYLKPFHERGFAVLSYDYPGYGTSEGRTTEAGVVAAARAALDYAHETLGWDYGSILSYGRSLGGGPALELAREFPIGGTVLEATFTSTFRVMTHWRLLPWDIFDNRAAIRQSRSPLLLFHGRQDMTVPFRHGEALLRAAPPGTAHLWIDEANHENLIALAGESFWASLDAFAQRHLRPHSRES